MVQHKISVGVYSCTVYVVITEDLTAFAKELNNIYEGAALMDGSEGFMFTPDMKIYYVVFDEQYLSHNTIAHELFHLTCAICEDRDVVEEEARAWLSGFLSENIYKFIEKKKLVIKKDA